MITDTQPAAPVVDRSKFLGSTDIGTILGVNPHQTQRELQLEKRGMLEPDGDNPSTLCGRVAEPGLLDFAESQLGPIDRDVRIAGDANAIGFPLSVQCDGLVVDGDATVEAKSTGLAGPVYGDWGDPGSDVVPPYYIVQATAAMIAAERDRTHLYALIGGRGIVPYLIPRDEELCETIIERSALWWRDHVIYGRQVTEDRPLPLDVVRRIRRVPEKTADLDTDATALVERWQKARRLRLKLEKAEDAAKAEVIAALGDAEAGVLDDGREVTYLEQVSRYSAKPATERPSRTLRLKKGVS